METQLASPVPASTGANRWGQLGRGDTNATGDDPLEMGDNLVPVDLGTGEVAAALALGEEHTCVLLESGDVKVEATKPCLTYTAVYGPCYVLGNVNSSMILVLQ